MFYTSENDGGIARLALTSDLFAWFIAHEYKRAESSLLLSVMVKSNVQRLCK